MKVVSKNILWPWVTIHYSCIFYSRWSSHSSRYLGILQDNCHGQCRSCTELLDRLDFVDLSVSILWTFYYYFNIPYYMTNLWTFNYHKSWYKQDARWWIIIKLYELEFNNWKISIPIFKLLHFRFISVLSFLFPQADQVFPVCH